MWKNLKGDIELLTECTVSLFEEWAIEEKKEFILDDIKKLSQKYQDILPKEQIEKLINNEFKDILLKK